MILIINHQPHNPFKTDGMACAAVLVSQLNINVLEGTGAYSTLLLAPMEGSGALHPPCLLGVNYVKNLFIFLHTFD